MLLRQLHWQDWVSNLKAPPAREAMEKRTCVLLKVNGEEYRVKKEWWRDSVQGTWFCRPLLGRRTLQNQWSESSAQSHEAEMERIQE